MTLNHPGRGNRRGCWLLLAAVFGLAAPVKVPAQPAKRAPLYVSVLDQLQQTGDSPAINALDERRRGPAFAAVLQAAAKAGELPQVIIVNQDIDMPSTVLDERPVPPGATLARVFVTQWSSTRIGGFAQSEVLCRIFVELVRDGHRVAKLGPFLGRTLYDLTAVTTVDDRQFQFEAAARLAVDGMARGLPR